MAYVELHPFDPLTLDDLAQVAHLSPYHFARQFNARYGLAPMAFVRARRLGLAARRLASGEARLVDLAFDVGFETQEGFTRAFKRAFGVPPGRFRRERAGPISPETLAMTDIAPSPRLSMEERPRKAGAFRVVGVSGFFDDTSKAGIPALWPRLAQRLPLPGQLGRGTFGVCWGEARGGGFHYLASVRVGPDQPAPEGLEIKDVPAQSYLVFRHQLDGSELHPQMQAAVREIWGERVPKSGYQLAHGPDLEVYPDDFDPRRPGSWVEWWIPVVDAA